jgi:hypothetical protein
MQGRVYLNRVIIFPPAPVDESLLDAGESATADSVKFWTVSRLACGVRGAPVSKVIAFGVRRCLTMSRLIGNHDLAIVSTMPSYE